MTTTAACASASAASIESSAAPPPGSLAGPSLPALREALTSFLQTLHGDVDRACAALSRQTNGARSLILQQLALRRASAHAANYQATLKQNARRAQRLRLELTNTLQRTARRLIGRRPRHDAPSAATRPLENFIGVCATLREFFAAEDTLTSMRYPLCPPLPALREFLRVCLLERGLHSRVAVADGGGRDDAALDEMMQMLSECTFHTAAAPEPADTGGELCVPVIMSLEQFCCDGLHVTVHDAAGDDERRRQRAAAASSPAGAGADPSDRVGFLFALPTPRASATPAPADDDASATAVPADALHAYAPALVTALTAAVDAAWAGCESRVEALVLSLLRERRRRRLFNDNSGGGAGAASSAPVDVDIDEAEVSAISADEQRELADAMEFVDVARVLYGVELCSRVLGLCIAAEVIQDSEDFVCFDGIRRTQLVLGPAHGEGTAAALPLLPLSVLNLPGMEHVLFCVAYTAGLALLRDAPLCQSSLSLSSSPSRSWATAVDVDAFRNEEESDEEAAARAWTDASEALVRAVESVCQPPPPPPSALDLFALRRVWAYVWEHVIVVSASAPLPGSAAAGAEHIVVPPAVAQRLRDRQTAASLRYSLQHAVLLQFPPASDATDAGGDDSNDVTAAGAALWIPRELLASAAEQHRKEVQRLWEQHARHTRPRDGA